MIYRDVINVKRKTTTDLGSGSFSQNYNLFRENIKATVQPKSLQDILRAGRVINSSAFTCYTAITEDIIGDDIIVFNGEDYAIVSQEKYPNNYIKMYLEKII